MKLSNVYLILFAIALVLLLADDGEAAELYMGVDTFHISEGDYNEDNHLLSVSHNKWEAATFVSSYNVRSYSLGRHLLEYDFSGLTFRISAGAIYGYSYSPVGNIDCPGSFTGRDIGICPYVTIQGAYYINDAIAIQGVLMGNAVNYGISFRW